jgi:hypothetical protein
MCALKPGSKIMHATFRRVVGGRSNPGGADMRTRQECWGATSADERWLFVRIEDTGTPWAVYPADADLRARVGWVIYTTSLQRARIAVAAGRADARLERLLAAQQP